MGIEWIKNKTIFTKEDFEKLPLGNYVRSVLQEVVLRLVLPEIMLRSVLQEMVVS